MGSKPITIRSANNKDTNFFLVFISVPPLLWIALMYWVSAAFASPYSVSIKATRYVALMEP